jgi:isoleucyl-tRNA synthetase
MRASRPIAVFINDLSTWYLRRSRERLKDHDQAAIQTLGYVLLKLVKLLAPFTPFLTEEIYQQLSENKESVHLEVWPQAGSVMDRDVLEKMELARWAVSILLEERKKNGIAVKQVLQDAEISGFKLAEEYLDLIKNEINVKEVRLVAGIEKAARLNLVITPELKLEGLAREIIRQINAGRKEQGLTVKDRVRVAVYGAEGSLIQKTIDVYQREIEKGTLADEVIYKVAAGASDDKIEKIEITKI